MPLLMVHLCRWHIDAIQQTILTPRILRQVQLPAPLPMPIVESLSLWMFPLLLRTIMDMRTIVRGAVAAVPNQLGAAWLITWTQRSHWHA